MINEELLTQTLEQIDNHPEDWNQKVWGTTVDLPEGNTCGTAYCFAGWAVKLAGYEPVFNCGTSRFAYDAHVADEVREIAAIARDLLGLTWEQANQLFASHNTREDLHLITKKIIEGEL